MHEDLVTILPVTGEVARRNGELFAELRAAGTPIPVNDIWIAAATIERDAFTAAAGYPPHLFVDGIRLLDRVWLDFTW